MAKFYLTINDPLYILPDNDQDLDHENDPLYILPDNDQDLDHENIVNTYLFYQVYKVNDIVCFRDQYSNAEKPWYIASDISA